MQPGRIAFSAAQTRSADASAARGVWQEGGVEQESEEQSHAISYSPGQTMPCPNSERDIVPVASVAERRVQDARWNEPGGTKGESERP
jgi:hypothetical protein